MYRSKYLEKIRARPRVTPKKVTVQYGLAPTTIQETIQRQNLDAALRHQQAAMRQQQQGSNINRLGGLLGGCFPW